MLKTGKILKQLYPQLFHVQCLSHLLHNCAEEIRAKFKDTDNLIARIKLAVQKNPTRRHMFHEIGTPPNPVITRWGTWLDAAVNYYAKNLPEVKSIVRRFEIEGQLVARAVEAVRSCNVDYELTEISRCYQNLLPLMAKMEGSTYSIFEGYNDITGLRFGTDPCGLEIILEFHNITIFWK